MGEEHLLTNVDNLLLQIGLQTRELSQKKNELSQQIQVCKDHIAERKSYVETMRGNVKKLEEEVIEKQRGLEQNKANTRSLKETSNLLLQYEQTLKVELDNRNALYNHDLKMYEERISNYTKTFQCHEDSYLQNPLAQKFLQLQTENEELEARITICDGQLTKKETELNYLKNPPVNSISPGNLPENHKLLEEEPESREEDDRLTADISAIDLNQNVHISVQPVVEKMEHPNTCQESPRCVTSLSAGDNDFWSQQQLNEVQPKAETIKCDSPKTIQTDDPKSDAEDQETQQEDQEHPTGPAVQTVLQEKADVNEKIMPCDKVQQEASVFTEASLQESNPKYSATKTPPTTPTPTQEFPFSFGLASSPFPGVSAPKSPAFVFNLNSNPNTPGFSGFGFDSSQDEDSSFTFTETFFSDKKPKDGKGSNCQKFLFDQPEQNEDFQFAFSAKSPKPGGKDGTGGEFPFSFNF